MKIVMIGQKGITGQIGGVETHVMELSTRLVRTGHTVVAYGRHAYATEGVKTFNGIRVVHVPGIRTKHLDAITHTFMATLHACFITRPDVYHFHAVGPSLLAWIPRILAPRAAVITTFHCLDRLHGKWGPFARFMLKLGERACVTFADETIASSKTLASYIKENYGRRVTYINYGITPRRVSTDPLLLEPFGLQPFRYVLMVSRLVPHKGAHTLVAAWKKAKVLNPELLRDYKLAIVGGSSFTDDYVRQLRADASNDPSIVFTDYQSGETLEALFAGAAFVAHPSLSEGMSIAVLEAMSYGKAVIAADIPENLEAIKDYGVSFTAGEADDLATKLIELAGDPTRAASLGHMAREFVEESYHWDDKAGEVLRIYRQQTLLRDGVLATH